LFGDVLQTLHAEERSINSEEIGVRESLDPRAPHKLVDKWSKKR